MSADRWSYDKIAHIYELDMGLNMSHDDIQCYLKLLGPATGRILEVGSGTGRLTHQLVAAGWQVTAIERSQPMIQAMHQRHPDLTRQQGFEIHHACIEKFGDFKANSLDAVVFPYSVICYITDMKALHRMLARLSLALKENGALIIDAFIPRKSGLTDDDFVLDYTRQHEGLTMQRYKKITNDVRPGVNQIHRRYVLSSEPGQEVIETTSEIRPYTPTALRQLMQKFGFEVLAEWFDYQPNSDEKQAQFYTLKSVKKDLKSHD